MTGVQTCALPISVNIEGLVGGYTGPGGKTVLPHRAVAKIDMRLVPGMKMDDAVAALKAHLAKRGYGDIEVNVSGGYDSTSTPRSEEHTSELQSLMRISYAVFCLKKKNNKQIQPKSKKI